MSTQPRLQVIDGGKPADSRAALRELYTQYGGTVYGRCQYLLGDRTKAEDAMQDVFAKALQNLKAFREESSPLSWLMKIATHHCLNVLRADRAAWKSWLTQEQKVKPQVEGGPERMESRDHVRKLLARFDVETQAAAVHYYVDEMTLEDVAKLLGRSVPTIRKRLETFARAGGQDL
jgi:RNA polymerase sigma-70 factor (ECF subfamily)